MKILLLCIISIFLTITLNAQTPNASGVVFVKTIAAGTGNGSSWANATTNLQGAINATGVSQVWVAAGIYQLATNTSYVMKNGVAIYGSFPATGTPTMTDRNFTTHTTTLKGNGASVIYNDYNGLTVTAILDGFTITGGSADSGGGIFNNSSSPSLSNLTISGNTAVFTGGGICNFYYSSPSLINVCISGNTAVHNGGGIYNISPLSSLINVSISGNTANFGGGIYSETAITTIKNSIILGNSTGVKTSSVSPQTYTNSIVQDLTATTSGNISAGALTANDIFTAPQAPGQSTGGDYTLKAGSLAINSGRNADNATSFDLAGNARIQKGAIDMGAYESAFAPILVPDVNKIVYVKVNGAGSFKGDSWINATDNLQGAINATGVSQVWVAKGIYQLAAGTSYTMKNGVAIYGSFPDTGTPTIVDRNFTTHTTILKGNGAASVIKNIFYTVSPLTSTASLDGFTVTGGGGTNGGGIYNSYASPILTNITLTGNQANQGGGIYNGFNSSPILTNVTISGNTASLYGGGIFNSTNSSPILTNVTISGNSSTVNGGGIHNGNSSSPILTNVTLSGNTATQAGGAMYNDNDTSPKLRNSIILGNNTGVFNSTLGVNVPVYTNSLIQGIAASGNNLDGTAILRAAVFTDFTNANYTLKAGSPAINAGDKTLFNAGQTPDLSAITTDLTGNPRVVDNAIDMGAYEYQVIAVLPLNLSAFTATTQNKVAKLKWTAGSQQNNKSFIISRSNDAVNFKELSRVEGHGNTNVMQSYAYNDNAPLNGINYYHLQQIDYDGKITSLGVKALDFNLMLKDIKVYPNPVVAVTTITFEATKYHELSVWDINGKLLDTLEVKPTDTSLNIDFSRYPSGLYLISITGAGESVKVKVLKK